MSYAITLTEKAAEEFKQMQKEEKKEGYGIKFDIFPAGCSGFQYFMDFAKEADSSDETVESEGLKIFIPKESLPLVNDCKIDYIEDEDGFKIDNPNLTSGGGGCGSGGCGSRESGCGS